MSTNEKVWFLRGLLIATAMLGETLTYDQVRRLCRLSDRQVGTMLGKARAGRPAGSPDFCAVVQKSIGSPGKGWGDIKLWIAELKRVHSFWQDRAELDNNEFFVKHGVLPL